MASRPTTSAPHAMARRNEPRESIANHVLKKRRPAGADSPHDRAARVEVVLRHDVSDDYADPDFLVQRYEEKLPIDQAAFAQGRRRDRKFNRCLAHHFSPQNSFWDAFRLRLKRAGSRNAGSRMFVRHAAYLTNRVEGEGP